MFNSFRDWIFKQLTVTKPAADRFPLLPDGWAKKILQKTEYSVDWLFLRLVWVLLPILVVATAYVTWFNL